MGKGEADACSPPLPALPPCGDGNDDDEGDRPPLTCGTSSEATSVEVAALVLT
jgi:hypothetical protein